MNKAQILGIVRHVLTIVGGGLVAKGYVTQGELEMTIGAIITLLGVGLSLWDKRNAAAVILLSLLCVVPGVPGCASGPGTDPAAPKAIDWASVATALDIADAGLGDVQELYAGEDVAGEIASIRDSLELVIVIVKDRAADPASADPMQDLVKWIEASTRIYLAFADAEQRQRVGLVFVALKTGLRIANALQERGP